MSQHANPRSLFKLRFIALMLAAGSAASDIIAQPMLLLRAGAIDPRALAGQLAEDPAERSDAHLLVQFDARRVRDVRAALLRAGATIEGYVPESAYRVRRVGVSAEILRAIDGVRWVGTWRREWKVEPVLARAAALVPPNAARTIEIFGFVDGTASTLRALVNKHLPNARIVAQSTGARLPRIAIEVRGNLPEALAAFSGSDEVSWINAYAPPQLDNTEAAGVIQGGTIAARSMWSRGITGTGQIVALADSGLDANEGWFIRYNPGGGLQTFISAAQATTPPLVGVMHANAKVIGNWVQPGAVAYETLEPCGPVLAVQHGTHVAGSIAGDAFATATPSNANADPGDGMAPNAQLLMQDIGADCLVISDYPAILAQAYAAGARIHNNSWGSANGGAYSGFDFDADDTIWRLEDLLVVASAGNLADNFNAVGSPGAAKNVLTVGALNHGESTQWAVFTSIGHSNGKPIKPDIAAPGVDTVSADGDDQSLGPEEPAVTRTLSGTSMATPTVAGGAALLRQYLVDGFYPRGVRRSLDRWRPLAATLKAVLMNGTTELLNDFVGETRLPSPITGWGRIFLDRDLFFPGDVRRHRIFERAHGSGIASGETHVYSIDVVNTGESLRATLVWSDAAGLPGVDYPLVNDLDLRVIGPGGAVFRGNAFGDSQSRPGFLVESIADFGAPDRKHSVEAVRLLLPSTGTYTIEVNGFNVPGNDRVASDRQGYSLVVAGALNLPTLAAIAPPPTNVHVTSNDLAGIAIAYDAVANADAYQLYRANGACKDADLADFHLAGIDSAVAMVDPNTVGGDRYAYRVRAVVDDVEGDASTCVDVVSADTCTLPPLADLAAPMIDAANATCSVALAWNAAPARCANSGAVSYRVERADSADFAAPVTIAMALPTPQFVDATALPGRIYFYRTFAIDSFGNSSAPSAIGNATPVGEGGPAGLGFRDDADNSSFVQLESPWQIASGAGVSASMAYKTGAAAAIYPAMACASVTLVPLIIPDGAQLVYDARFQLENAWDGVVVEISTDEGERWIDLAPDGGYPGSFAQTQEPPINACGYPNTRAAFSGDNGAFTTYTSSLAAFAGQRVRIRWRLSTDPGLEFEGFRLDQIRITSPGDELPPDLILRSGFGNDDAAAVGMSCQLPP